MYLATLIVTTVLVGWLSGGGLMAMVFWCLACGLAWWVGTQLSPLRDKLLERLRKVSERSRTLQ